MNLADCYMQFKGHLGQARALESLQKQIDELQVGDLNLQHILQVEVLIQIHALREARETQQQALGNQLNGLEQET